MATDKQKHLLVGITLGILFQLAGFWLLPQHHYWATAAAFIIIFSISYGWELLSKITGKGHYEVMDAVYSIVGGIIGMGIIIIALVLQKQFNLFF